MLVVDGGHSLDSYERWVARTLVAALLPDPTDPTGPR